MLAKLLINTKRSPETIRRIQERKLRTIIDHAHRNVPFYRKLYQSAGINLQSIRGLDDLQRLPLISKSDLRDQPLSEILAAGADPAECRSSSSSGTTGVPLMVYWLPKDRAIMNLSWKRAYLTSGMGFRDRMAAFIGRRQSESRNRWHERLGFFPQREISSWLEPRLWIEALRAWNPQVITGYVMTLRLLAEHLREQGTTDIRPRLLFHTSALLDDSSRDLFSRVFASRVIDIYGSEEAGCVAWECRICAAYHIAADMLIVEVLKDGKPARPGEQGEVVVTNLHSRVMPFIRYRQGDVATVSGERPRCGNSFPLLSKIEGRIEDFLVLRSGRRMPPHPFYHCIDPVSGVKRWQIQQNKAGTMRLELVTDGNLTPGDLQKIQEDLATLTQGQMGVEIAIVKEIPILPGAKFRTICSQVGKWSP